MQEGPQFLYINKMECLDVNMIIEKIINAFGVNSEQLRKRRSLKGTDGKQVNLFII